MSTTELLFKIDGKEYSILKLDTVAADKSGTQPTSTNTISDAIALLKEAAAMLRCHNKARWQYDWVKRADTVIAQLHA
jgi:hypothetical protein